MSAATQWTTSELARWTRFAQRGGIGRCAAVQDCVAEAAEDLMFLKNDEIIVLMQLADEDNMYLGYCEGIVGRFRGQDVRFLSKLKKPVMTKRSLGFLSSTVPNALPAAALYLVRNFAQKRELLYKLGIDLDLALYLPFVLVSPRHPGNRLYIPGTARSVADAHILLRMETIPRRLPMLPPHETEALTRKPVNGSRLAVSMQTVESEESEREEPEQEPGTGSSDEQYSPQDGEWVHVPETLPLQVVKLNSPTASMPPSPYQSMSAAFEEPGTKSSHPDLDSASGTDSASEYGSSEGENDTTTKFPLPPDRRSHSPTSPRLIDVSQRSSYSSVQRRRAGSDPTRASVIAPSLHGSEDGEVGIGLSLLQGLASADGDASSDEDGDMAPLSAERNQKRQSAGSSARSVPPHAEDWDGASIYDNYYRFSRFSVNPRSSGSTLASTSMKKSSRLSYGSQRGIPGPSTEAVPPIPVDLRQEPESSARSEKTRSVDSDASVYTQASKRESIDPARLFAQVSAPTKHRPASLELVQSNGEPSPLLHTRWGSPNSSASPPSAQTGFFDLGSGLASASSGSISPGGAASILRQRIELERGSPAGSNYTDTEPQEETGLGSGIVIEDDEEPPPPSITDGPTSESPDDEFVEDMELEDDSAQEPEPGHEALAPLVIADSLPPPNATWTAPPSTASTSPPSSVAATPLSPSSPASPEIPQPPPLQSPSAQHQPKPSLSELRGYMQAAENSPWDPSAGRTSLFLPHPNAPKPPPMASSQEGPMYIRAPPPPSQQQSESVVNIIKMSIGRSAVTRVMPTIYGRVDGDLGSATGPVRVTFSIDPPPPLPQLPSQIPFRNGGVSPAPPPPKPIAIPSPSPRRKASSGGDSEASPTPTTQPGSPASTPRPPGRSPIASPSPGSAVPTKSSPLAASSTPASEQRPSVIPRPNFFPKAGTARPRSRSFSGFNTSQISSPLPLSKEEPVKTTHAQKPSRSMSTLAAPVSASSTSAPPSSPPSLGKHASRSSLRSAHAPSPLSLPQNNSVLGVRGNMPRSPTSPLALSPVAPSPVSTRQLRQTASRSTLNEPSHSQRPSFSRNTPSSDSSAASPIPTRNESVLPNSDRPSMDIDPTNRVLSPTGTREALRHKLSLPNLRRNQSRQSTDSPSPGLNDTVQIENMDFELIRPNVSVFDQQGSGRSSEDSSLGGGRDPSMDGRASNIGDARGTDSPALSISSSQAPWSSSSDNNSIDAHRQRELKWVSLMGAVPPAQAKKNKKVKKLLMDGSVPSSVRFLVWSHLTDGKAKAIPGVYAQLGKRARVAALDTIERDVQQCFSDHPHMHSSQGSLVTVLQAYLTMVPDVQYSKGLTLIAGHLVALSPEEDAFWIFVSVMDSYLRPYFSSSTTQLEVDAALFSRALEANNPQLGKRVLVELGINPVDLCRPWFTTLFSDALPLEYLNRVWDLFLFEGIPFLFRVSLALFQCCRRPLLEAKSVDHLFHILVQPPPNLLPPSPDALIGLAFSVKLKDDDLRKQRVKMEAQVKRQTQVPRGNPAASRSLSIPRV
ncbi:Rab-GAP TBC domain-containing protein [Mycena kentingensis (nom. inval.)]|nr:Rab-GAP TBC domain-containing protein [Mycena kentingensis (nom. inval.)]